MAKDHGSGVKNDKQSRGIRQPGPLTLVVTLLCPGDMTRIHRP